MCVCNLFGWRDNILRAWNNLVYFLSFSLFCFLLSCIFSWVNGVHPSEPVVCQHFNLNKYNKPGEKSTIPTAHYVGRCSSGKMASMINTLMKLLQTHSCIRNGKTERWYETMAYNQNVSLSPSLMLMTRDDDVRWWQWWWTNGRTMS